MAAKDEPGGTAKAQRDGRKAIAQARSGGRSAWPWIGALRADDGKVVRVFVNGKPQAGNPAAVLFGAHDEIAVVYGTPRPGETIPSTYAFPEGE